MYLDSIVHELGCRFTLDHRLLPHTIVVVTRSGVDNGCRVTAALLCVGGRGRRFCRVTAAFGCVGGRARRFCRVTAAFGEATRRALCDTSSHKALIC